MNYLNYKTGTLIVNNTEIELSKIETKILVVLSDNKLKTYEDIYNSMYNVDIKESDQSMRNSIKVHSHKIRKKTNFTIQTKSGVGLRLLNQLCVY